MFYLAGKTRRREAGVKLGDWIFLTVIKGVKPWQITDKIPAPSVLYQPLRKSTPFPAILSYCCLLAEKGQLFGIR